MQDYLEQLNEAQREAVTTTEGYVRVIAGAGSGKTRALTCRFAYLVNELGIMPGNILCVTFTNKAAQEMRQRIYRMTGDNDTGYINTFHGFCVSVLDEESYAVQYPKSFLVLDNSDIDSMLKIIYEERSLTLRDMSFGDARDMIEMQKLFKKPEYYMDLIALPLEDLHEKYRLAADVKDIIFYGYLYQEKKCFGLDYNDLIIFTLHIFREHEDIRLKWQQRLEYIMIDEFQDIDQLQYGLMEALQGYHKNLFIVGDPDQTIYTWRGANTKFLMDFDKSHEGTKTIMMLQNYRSTPQIVAAANALIGKNKHRIVKDLEAVLPDGPKPVYSHAGSQAKEAHWMAEKIRALADAGTSLSDIAVLYRAHYITRNIEEVFLREKLPYKIYSGVQFFDRMEIKDTLSYLRMLAYKDDLSFRRIANVPKRNLGLRRMQFLEETAEKEGCSLYQALQRHLDDEIFKGTKAAKFVALIERFAKLAESMPISELFAKLADESGYEAMLRTEGSQERLDNLAELKQSILEYEISCGEETSLQHYLEHVALFSNAEQPVADGKVKLMTIHAAKGLEFPHVFLCALNEDVFPSKKVSTLEAMEEERRLAFVAVTRAQKTLYLSDAEGRTIEGTQRYPSRFLFDTGFELLDVENAPPDDLVRDAKELISVRLKHMPENLAKTALPEGTRVRHEVFGEGTVLDFDAGAGVYVIQFDMLDTPRRLNARLKLEVL
ncbi:MAG: UvrD-helicase domain-containing protein [Firmicutes bacterium]|nr:UvrD-helicase domain-containing protein [Bacillota bacterium]